jgi:predicted AAA+ superfamily ATPase
MQRKMMIVCSNGNKEKHRKPLLLKGVRQVGKTHLIKEFGRHHFPQFHYFNLKNSRAC